MKTKIIYLLIALIVTSGCGNTTNEKKEWGEWELYGNIKSVEEITFKPKKKSDEPVKGIQKNSVFFLFNNKGENIEFIRSWGGQFIKATKEYDLDGNLIKYIAFDENGNQGNTHTYVFESGNCIKFDFYSKYNDYTTTDVYKYDENGNQIEKINYNETKEVTYSVVFKYDVNNNLVEETGFDKDKTILQKVNYKYINAGNLSEEEYIDYDENGEFLNKSVYLYTENKRIEEVLDYDKFGNLEHKNIYSYNVKGHKLKEVDYNSKGEEQNSKVYKYDNDGNLIEITSYYQHGTQKHSFTYEFDEHKNWIKQNWFKDGEIEYTKERKIEYFIDKD